MKYTTTRSDKKTYSLREAAFEGLAPDGGLFMPAEIPHADMREVGERAASSFAEMAEYLAGLFFADDLPREELREVTREAFDFPVPMRRLDKNVTSDTCYTLELFHGPTAAFKDFGAGFMGRMLARLRPEGERLTILTATSGDTGSAVAHGFHGVEGIDVVVLYPDGKISDLQESQMTTLGGNIHALRVAGTFDDCQRMVKELFSDVAFRAAHRVTSANSINLLRWIPQSFYYFWGVLQWQAATGGTTPEIVVPSGNYGNLSAGMLARRMGLPVRRFVAASNANDVVPEWLRTGDYRPRPSVLTVANAMDVGAPSNYERMMALCGSDVDAVRREVSGFASSDEEIRRAIRELYDRYGYISDPHSAAGYAATVGCGVDGFWLSTASAAKFGEVIEPVLGLAPEIPERLARLLGRPKVSTPVAPDSELLKEFVAEL
ncbi:MAG: threonine synthase [Alistipes sp.]|jgi:threonine synthase|nr:threonine synthase [Alistipes sp.]